MKHIIAPLAAVAVMSYGGLGLTYRCSGTGIVYAHAALTQWDECLSSTDGDYFLRDFICSSDYARTLAPIGGHRLGLTVVYDCNAAEESCVCEEGRYHVLAIPQDGVFQVTIVDVMPIAFLVNEEGALSCRQTVQFTMQYNADRRVLLLSGALALTGLVAVERVRRRRLKSRQEREAQQG